MSIVAQASDLRRVAFSSDMFRRLLGSLNSYVYELREGDAIVATGRLTLDAVPQPGGTLQLAGRAVTIIDVTVRNGEVLLILEIQ